MNTDWGGTLKALRSLEWTRAALKVGRTAKAMMDSAILAEIAMQGAPTLQRKRECNLGAQVLSRYNGGG